jgi:hypothetical protein
MNTIIKNIQEITGCKVQTNESQQTKLDHVSLYLNPSKYNIIGLVGRTNDVVLAPRYHNVRDKFGRFAKVRGSRR